MRVVVRAWVTVVTAGFILAMATPAQAQDRSTDCQVVLAAVEAVLSESSNDTATVLFMDSTYAGKAMTADNPDMKNVLADSRMLLTYTQRMQARHPLCQADELPPRLHIVSSQSLVNLTPRQVEFWKAFAAAYPGVHGYVRASAVGYSANGSRAMVFIQHGCGERCGRSDVVILEKMKEGNWRIVQTTMLWIA